MTISDKGPGLGRLLLKEILLAMAFYMMLTAPVFAKEVHKDVAGSKDYPLLGRYQGAFIIGYEQKKYTDFTIPLTGPKNWNEPPDRTLPVEGRHTRILYVAPKDRSTLEIFRNYEKQLKDKGSEILFSCEKETCGKKAGLVMVRQTLYPQNAHLKNSGQMSEMAFSSPVDMRYMVAKVTGKNSAYFSLFTAKETFKHFERTAGRALILLDIVEVKPMENKMVVVPAKKMARELSEKGALALYGIYFDTDSSGIKPESQSTLLEIKKLFADSPKLKLYIVGHTDNVGGLDYNRALSSRRAKAVRDVLVNVYGVSASRLAAYGVGMLAPKATNETEKGRSLNRRVELVKQ